ncbi:MAG: hypothetical protein QXF24_01365 [Thermoproteota archaeon]
MAPKPFPSFALALLFASASLGSAFPAGQATKQEAMEAISAAEESSKGTFLLIKEADREGGNVSALAKRFNAALELLDQARALEAESLHEQASALAQEAERLFDAIGGDAVALRERAAEDASKRRTAAILGAPFAAAIIALLAYFLARFWQKSRIRKVMGMRVEEAGQR